MAKKELKLHAVVSPTETVVVSAYDKDGNADACTLAFYMVSSHVPPCVTIAINATQRRKTLKDILETKAFVLSFSSEDQVKEADYLGVESGYNTDKLKNAGFTTSAAKTVNAPVITEGMVYNSPYEQHETFPNIPFEIKELFHELTRRIIDSISAEGIDFSDIKNRYPKQKDKLLNALLENI